MIQLWQWGRASFLGQVGQVSIVTTGAVRLLVSQNRKN